MSKKDFRLDKIVALLSKPKTRADLSEDSGFPLNTVRRCLEKLLRSDSIHISGWVQAPGARRYSAVYLVGPGKNLSLDDAKAAIKNARKNFLYESDRAIGNSDRDFVPRRDKTVEAFFGPYKKTKNGVA